MYINFSTRLVEKQEGEGGEREMSAQKDRQMEPNDCARVFFVGPGLCFFVPSSFEDIFLLLLLLLLVSQLKTTTLRIYLLVFLRERKGGRKKKELDKRQKSRHATRQEVHVIGGGSGRQRQGVGCRCFGSAFKRKGKRKKKKT